METTTDSRRCPSLPGAIIAASRRLCAAVETLTFPSPVAFVYNPLRYARALHEQYVTRYAGSPRRVLFVGMNPGPWGMAQTGVPFGDVETVRSWLRIQALVGRPALEHRSRPVLGLDCQRVEVSGRRLWGLARERFGEAASFFREHFVTNYCPLLFLDEDGRNRTPDRLPAAGRDALEEACDRHLGAVARALRPEWLVGVGRFAFSRIQRLIDAGDLRGVAAARVSHPSPASPRANTGWAELATRELESQGVWPRLR